MAKRIVSNAREDFSLKNLDVIRADIESALKPVGERYNLTFGLGRLTYWPASFNVRLEAKRPDSDKQDFEQYAASCGLRPSDFGAVFTYENAKYTISGINPRSDKYPIVTTREDGQRINFRENIVRDLLKSGLSNGN